MFVNHCRHGLLRLRLEKGRSWLL